jgi:hypothetical protein
MHRLISSVLDLLLPAAFDQTRSSRREIASAELLQVTGRNRKLDVFAAVSINQPCFVARQRR